MRNRAPGRVLIDSYMADLGRLLADHDDRNEVLSLVEEHIMASLGVDDDALDEKAVQSVLDELGPVEAIAAMTPADSLGRWRDVEQQGKPRIVLQAIALGVATLNVLVALLLAPLGLLISLATGAVAATLIARGRRRTFAIVLLSLSCIGLLTALVVMLFLVRTEIAPLGDPTPVPM